jgi:hypothetical protein
MGTTTNKDAMPSVWPPTYVADVRVMVSTGDVQPGTRASFIAADRGDDAGKLDAAAGCEFVDDRIRLRE